MPESIDYYMDGYEKQTLVYALRIAIAFAEAEYLKAELIYDKEKMAAWDDQIDRFKKMRQQLE